MARKQSFIALYAIARSKNSAARVLPFEGRIFQGLIQKFDPFGRIFSSRACLSKMAAI